MKRIFIMLIAAGAVFAGCAPEPIEVSETPEPPVTSGTTTTITTTAEPLVESTSLETSLSAPYYTKEISRDENYKIMEMYVYDNDGNATRRITFELPVEWRGKDSVFTNDENFKYTLKVDMWNVKTATREDVINSREYTLYNYLSGYETVNIINNNIYFTDNYEIFQYEFNHIEGAAYSIFLFYLYSGEERFYMTCYVFEKNKPEYDDILKRIVESVRF